jgi:hypothetical protein
MRLLDLKQPGKIRNIAFRYGVVMISIERQLKVEWDELMINKEEPAILASEAVLY